MKGNWKIRVMNVKDIPITYEGKALHNIKNCLPAVLATYLFRDITIEDIRSGIKYFYSLLNSNTGTVEFFPFQKFHHTGRFCAQSAWI